MGNDLKPADLCNHTDAAGNDGSFSLSATHSPQARGHKHTPPQITRAQVPPASIQYRQLQKRTTNTNLKQALQRALLHFCVRDFQTVLCASVCNYYKP